MKKYATILFLFMFFLTDYSFAQICKPVISLHFEFGKDALTKADRQKLIDYLKTTVVKEYIIEVYAGTDDVGPEDRNMSLSERRAEYVKKVIEKNFPGKINSIRAIGKGELDPTFPNDNEHNKYLNRRADVMFFPVTDGKITFGGSKGSEIEVASDFFKTCAICESKPEVKEYLTEGDAASAGIPLIDTAGNAIITGGMVKLDFNCAELDSCNKASIRIPASQADPMMTVWESVLVDGQIRWINTVKPCYIRNNYYVFETECLNKGMKLYNCDKPGCTYFLETPYDQNQKLSVSDGNNLYYNVIPDFYKKNIGSISSLPPDCIDSSAVINHVAVLRGIEYSYKGKIFKHFNIKMRSFSIPESAYKKQILRSDTTVILKVPKNAIAYLRIPEIDSTNIITNYREKERKFQYKYPTAPSEIVVYDDQQNAYTFDYSMLKTRYIKRKKLMKIKVKRNQLRK